MQRKVPLLTEENYHIYNRGAHKQPIFLDEADYRRFQILLLLANSIDRIDVGNVLSKYQGPTLVNIFKYEKPDNPLVDILAYSLMPNHFHLVLRQREDEGISKFMQKIGTGYSMYFNLKNDHSGTLFQGKFKSRHINNDTYFQWIFAYVHLNPAGLIESEWASALKNPERAQNFLKNYPYSSYYDFYNDVRPQRSLLQYAETIGLLDKQDNIHALLDTYLKGKSIHEVA